MTAALTLLVILAVSLFVVRIGGTALRLTGMPLDAARFQSISALTGTGFTTQEAEITMHHPLRRRVLIGLMFAGHLGIVSLASTVILAVSTAQDGSVLLTVFYMLLAVIVICALAMSETVDRAICGIIATVLTRYGWFDKGQYLVVTELPDGAQVAEHTAQRQCSIEFPRQGLTVLRLNGAAPGPDTLDLKVGDEILCFGPTEEQIAFGKALLG